jgi:CHASE1-domain containing sensor protein
MEKRTVLDNQTLIPLGVTVIIFLASMWLTTVYVDGQDTKQDLVEFKNATDSKLERIESKIDRILERNDK